jgi:hypothetical protein
VRAQAVEVQIKIQLWIQPPAQMTAEVCSFYIKISKIAHFCPFRAHRRGRWRDEPFQALPLFLSESNQINDWSELKFKRNVNFCHLLNQSIVSALNFDFFKYKLSNRCFLWYYSHRTERFNTSLSVQHFKRNVI